MKYILEWTEVAEYRTEIEVAEPIRSQTAAEDKVDQLDRAVYEALLRGVTDRVVIFAPTNFLLSPETACPACGDPLGAYGISRYDNKTRLCTRCEVFEAMADLEGLVLMGPGLAEPYDEHDDDGKGGDATPKPAAIPTCVHCGKEIEYVDGVGWVEIEEGGHYDHCTENWSEEDLDGGGHEPKPSIRS